MLIIENEIAVDDVVVPITIPIDNMATHVPLGQEQRYCINDYTPRTVQSIIPAEGSEGGKLVNVSGRLGSFSISSFRKATSSEISEPQVNYV